MRLFLLILLAFSAECHAQLRVVTYNVINTPDFSWPHLRTVLDAIGNESVNGIQRPIDVLLLQEVKIPDDPQALASVLNELCRPLCNGGTYRFGTLKGDARGGDRQGVVYRSDVVALTGEAAIGIAADDGQPRQTMRYDFEILGFDRQFTVYNSHFAASDEKRRLAESKAIREDSDRLGDRNVIYAGDFNIQSSEEEMYARLTAPGPGQAFDSVNRPGYWRKNPAFIMLHTQSPVKARRFGGQAEGGLDDRFDFQLVSAKLLDGLGMEILQGSYHAFGNNGTHPLEGEITEGTGASPSVLEALANGSDHLPLVADYLPAPIGDSNLDNVFDSGDLVVVFQAGLYETGQDARWHAGNWNGDRQFSSADLVFAFAYGRYATATPIPEPSGVCLQLAAFAFWGWRAATRSRRLPADY